MERKYIIKRIVASLMTALPLCCACTKSLPDADALDIGERLISITPATSATTKAAIDGTVFPNDRTMLMSAHCNGDVNANYFSGVTFSRSGSTWSENKYWPMNGTLDLLAVSHDGLSVSNVSYSSDVSEGIVFDVPDNSSSQIDILHASAQGQTYSSSGTEMRFRHAENVIVFVAQSTVAYNTSTNRGVTLTGITLNGAKYGGRLAIRAEDDPDDGYCIWSSLTNKKDKNLPGLTTYNVPTEAMDITAAGNHFGIGGRGIVVPEQPQTSFTVRYTTHNGKDGNGDNLDVDQETTYVCTGEWKEGKRTCYRIIFNANGISVAPSVEEWSVVSEEMAVPAPVSVTYAVDGLASLTLPKVIMGENAEMTVVWGDGEMEFFSKASGDEVTLSHAYPSAYTGKVKICVRKGDIVFSGARPSESECFNVLDADRAEVEYIKALEFKAPRGRASTFTLGYDTDGGSSPNYQYSTDGSTWNEWDYGGISVPAKGYVLVRGSNPSGINTVTDSGNPEKTSRFVMTEGDNVTNPVECHGNIMHLLSYTDDLTTIPNIGCFASLFNGCGTLVMAPKLPATVLKLGTYIDTFGGTGLTEAPELPATSLFPYCYRNMFSGCTSLATIPDLPATSLSAYCCMGMFSGCTSLAKAPELPATTAARNCYYQMFSGCTSLAEAPELPATLLASQCYGGMFASCSSLTEAPELPATTLAGSCYYQMFFGCTSLVKAPELPATALANYCYTSMFNGCTSLVKAPELPATTLAIYCYDSMFNGCTTLTKVPALPATELKSACYQSMFSGCTSLTEAPELPATALADYCYNSMFVGCISLAKTPELPATSLSAFCYSYMFYECKSLSDIPLLTVATTASRCCMCMFAGCSSLAEVPELTATVMSDYCYAYMFYGCSSLTEAPELPATSLSDNCYMKMFQNCTALTEAPELPATTLETGCYDSMFSNCHKLSSVTMRATANIEGSNGLNLWLSSAGAYASSPKLFVDPSMVGNATIQEQRGVFTVTAIP